MVTSSEYENFIYRVCKALGEPDGIIVHRNKAYTGRLSSREIRVDVPFARQLLSAHILGLSVRQANTDSYHFIFIG